MLGRRRCVQWGLATAGAALWAVPWRRSKAAASGRLGRLTLAIVRPESFCQLPLHLASQLGHIADEGLQVDWLVLPDLASAVQAVRAGRAQVLSGPTAWVAQARRTDRPWTAFVQQTRTPQCALGVARDAQAMFEDPSGSRVLHVAVPPASVAARQVVTQFLQRTRFALERVRWVELGQTAQALQQFRAGALQGVCFGDPLMTQLERDGLLHIAADARTVRGTQELFGALWPAACLCAPTEVAKARAEQCRALTHAVVRSLKWLQTAGLLDVSRAVDERYFLGDRGLYLQAFMRNSESWSADGVFAPDAAQQLRRWWRPSAAEWIEDEDALSGALHTLWAKEAKQRFRA